MSQYTQFAVTAALLDKLTLTLSATGHCDGKYALRTVERLLLRRALSSEQATVLHAALTALPQQESNPQLRRCVAGVAALLPASRQEQSQHAAVISDPMVL